MSHRSRRSPERSPHQERSHSHYSSSKYDKYDKYHRRRDDSRDRSERHHSKRSSHSDRKRRDSHSKYRSRSRSPTHSSRHHDDHSRSSHKSKDYKELKLLRIDDRASSKHSSDSVTSEKYNSGLSSNKPEKIVNNNPPKVIEMEPSELPTGTNQLMHTHNDTENQPIPTFAPDAYDENDELLEAERERVQREALQRLQKHLETEGKTYKSKPKHQASHPIYANDGSFLEMFKTMQNNMQMQQTFVEPPKPVAVPQPVSQPKLLPPIMKRRGGKILKTGVVQKKRIVEEGDNEAPPSDSWSAYLKEVSQYKKVSCSDDNITRSLVK